MNDQAAARPRSRTRRHSLRWWQRAVLVLGVACGALVATGVVARAVLLARTPPPGQRIDVGGYRMHLHCTGTGAPTVILEAGLLDFSVVWSRVQPVLGAMTRTCSYDRAGSGWSDPSPHPRTSSVMVDELRVLLSRARISGPVLLVGHSFGGMIARLHALRFPGEVVGLVLVDGAHPEQWDRIPELQGASLALAAQFHSLARLKGVGLLALARRWMPDRGLPEDAAPAYRTLLAASGYFGTAVGELEALPQSVAELRAASPRGASPLPVVVISRGLPAPVPGVSAAQVARMERVWRELQDEMAAAAPRRDQVIAARSGHDVHLQQPELVVEAVRRLMAARGLGR